jgi:hypothetical protein
MKIVRVTYTAKEMFAATNSGNIQKVMAELRQLNNPGIFYHVCLGNDGKTFVHTAFFKSDADEQTLLQLHSFIYFQQQLKEGGLETPPKQELLSLVGSSAEIFQKP